MSDGVQRSALSDSNTVLLHLMVRRRPSSAQQLNLNSSTSAADRQLESESAAIRTKATTYAGETNSGSASLSHKHRLQTRSSVGLHDYRQIAAAITSSPRKHLRPMPSPVFCDTATSRTATDADEAEGRQSQQQQRTGGICRSAATSHSRFPAMTASPVKFRISKPDVMADMGVTREQFEWLREVGRCLNPHRRQQW